MLVPVISLGIEYHVNLEDMQVGGVKIMPAHYDTLAVNEKIAAVGCHHSHYRFTLVSIDMQFPVCGEIYLRHPQFLECLYLVFNCVKRYLIHLRSGDTYAGGPSGLHDVIRGDKAVPG